MKFLSEVEIENEVFWVDQDLCACPLNSARVGSHEDRRVGAWINYTKVMESHIIREHLVAGYSSSDVELCPTQPSAQPSKDLRAILVRDVRNALKTEAPQSVLQRLCSNDDVLTTVDPSNMMCALVSYRQEKGFDTEFTMDDRALLGVVDAAEAASIEALWVDVWCYRFEGEYNHENFCETLHEVLTSIRYVIWLPRAKNRARGEYGYRLWCTFEASCVEQLNLPVCIAGIGLSTLQRRVRLLGSFTPALVGDGTVDELCRLNLFFYISELLLLIAAVDDLITSHGKTFINCIFAALIVMVWLCFRSTISHQVRLAGNARRVMRAMSMFRSKDFSLGEQISLKVGQRAWKHASTGKEHRHARWLLQDLPWLPAFDRRDTLVVQELLARIRPDLRLDVVSVNAMAFSAYMAARQSSNETAVSLFDWLKARNIVLAADSSSPGMSSVRSYRGEADELAGMTWLHGLDKSTGRPSACQPLNALRHLGWTVAPGVSCAFISPLGVVAIPPPAEGRWLISTASTRLIQRRRLVVVGTIWLALVSVVRPVAMVIWWCYGFESVLGQWALCALWFIFFVVWGTVVSLALLFGDFRDLFLRGFWPLPLTVFKLLSLNVVACLIMGGGAVYLADELLSRATLANSSFVPQSLTNAYDMQSFAFRLASIQFLVLLVYETVIHALYIVVSRSRAADDTPVG